MTEGNDVSQTSETGTVAVADSKDALDLTPRMTPGELGLLRSVASTRRGVIEYGCGGSTAQWIELGVPRILSVESDSGWIDKLSLEPRVGEAIASGRLSFIHADIGPTGRWGRPTDRSRMEHWPAYWAAPWDRPDASVVDFAFVDGRFRVSCALYSALQIGPSGLVAIHDFWKRDTYQVVLRHLDPVARCDDLAVFQAKPGMDAPAVVRDLAQYALDIR